MSAEPIDDGEPQVEHATNIKKVHVAGVVVAIAADQPSDLSAQAGFDEGAHERLLFHLYVYLISRV